MDSHFLQILLLTEVKRIDRNATLMTTDNSQSETTHTHTNIFLNQNQR